MDFKAFLETLSQPVPEQELPPLLVALWYDHHGDWDKAHTIVQQVNGPVAAWVHAYLHRKEGDIANAEYWYTRAGKIMPSYQLENEWEDIARNLTLQ